MAIARISRRDLIAAGISTAFLALVPQRIFAQGTSTDDLEPAGPNATNDMPINEAIVGTLKDDEVSSLTAFSNWAIAAWDLPEMGNYWRILGNDLGYKTSQRPSYLSEYRSAARIADSAKKRLGDDASAFVYLMFLDRQAASLATRLGRARHFVYDEIVRHLVSKGGFRRFGLTNYEGNFGTPLMDPGAYRRIET